MNPSQFLNVGRLLPSRFRRKSIVSVGAIEGLGLLNDTQRTLLNTLLKAGVSAESAIPALLHAGDPASPSAGALLRKHGVYEAAYQEWLIINRGNTSTGINVLDPIRQIRDPQNPIYKGPGNNNYPFTSPARIMSLDEIESLIISKSGSGDVISERGLLANFVAQPSVRCTITMLRTLSPAAGVPARDAIAHFLSLAFAESTWDASQVNSSGAAGALQIKPDTYRIAVSAYNAAVAHHPEAEQADLACQALLNSYRLAGHSMSPFNFGSPNSDLTQYKAMTGHMLKMFALVAKEWKYSNGVGYRAVKPNVATDAFVATQAGRLRLNGPGRQILLTAYGHGYYVFSRSSALTTPHVFRYLYRFARDMENYVKLESVRNLDQVMAVTTVIPDDMSGNCSVEEQMGDIMLPGDLLEVPNVSAINKLIALRLSLSSSLTAQGTAKVSSRFGLRTLLGVTRQHEGVDLRARTYLPVFAVDDGIIIRTEKSTGAKGYGNQILLRADDGSGFRYAHLSKVLVSVNRRVYKGQIIGISGNSGTKDRHLHFEYFSPNNMGTNLRPEVETDPLKDPKKRYLIAVNSQ